jgi:hypothetical protein
MAAEVAAEGLLDRQGHLGLVAALGLLAREVRQDRQGREGELDPLGQGVRLALPAERDSKGKPGRQVQPARLDSMAVATPGLPDQQGLAAPQVQQGREGGLAQLVREVQPGRQAEEGLLDQLVQTGQPELTAFRLASSPCGQDRLG